MAVEHWRSYLQPAEFIIQTDQKSLIHLDDQRLNSYWQQKALTKLLGLQYKICYKRGSLNSAADALLRKTHHDSEELLAISSAQPVWLQEIQDNYCNDEEAQRLLIKLAHNQQHDDFSLSQGIIRYKGRIWLTNNVKAQELVMHALHSSPMGGHSGTHVSYLRIKRLFFWPGMRADI